MDEWLVENMHAVLITIEVLWVGGFLAVFLAYFLVKRHFSRLKADRGDVAPPPSEREDQG